MHVEYCMNNYCVYWKDRQCTIDSIRIDETGMCADCIQVRVPGDALEKYREEHLENLDRRYPAD